MLQHVHYLLVFLCDQRILASWLEQRARHMELSEKVKEDVKLRTGKDSDTFSIKVKETKSM